MNNYNDDLPDWLQDEESDNNSGKAEIEPPTDGPPPDWMRVATSGSDTSLKEENTPDWLKDIKAGKGKAKENDVNNSEPSAATPSSQDSSSDELSDWERLLAEEGIDLSTVSEDRPQGAEGMSARDWLIASSDDEMIRKRVGGEPMAEPRAEKAPPPQPEPEPEPVPVEHDKMVVEEDLPDWLRDEVPVEEVFAAAEEPRRPPAAEEEEGLVVEAELPDWLQEFSEEDETPEEPVLAQAEPARPGTAPLAGPPAAHDEDKMVVEEDLPEWLREVADEVAAEPALAENLSDKSMAGLPISDFGPTDDEDLPDWLREAAAEEPEVEELVEALEIEPEEAPVPAVSWGDSMVVEEGLPDWLREVEEEAERDELAIEQVPQAPSPEEVEPVAAGADMPDWLREAEEEGGEAGELLFEYEAAGEAAAPIAGIDFEAEEGLPGWLREAQEGQVEAEAPVEAEKQPIPEDQLVVEEELPDWLREVEEEKEAGPEAEELPGWLQEAEAEEEQLAPAAEAPVGVTAGVEEIIDTEGLPDWLQEVQEEEEAFEPSEPSPEEEFVAEEELTLEGELPDWLRQVQDETQEVTIDEFDLYGEEEAEPVSEGEVIVAEELPDWLRGLEEEPEPEAVEAPPVAAVAEAAPAPEQAREEVAPPKPEPEPVPEPVVAVAPVPAPAAVEEPKPQPRPAPAGLPDWLKKLREGEREEERTAAARPAPRPAPALAAVEERSVVEIKTEEQAPDLPTDAEERLKLAREARDEGNMQDAVQIYDTLVSSGVYLHQIIEDMQQAIKSYPSNYLLYQLMGDAMMREGRLHSALEAYRQALARL